MLGIFYLFFLSSIFQVQKVVVIGNQQVSENNIQQEIDYYLNRRFLLFWRPRNILLANSEIISQKLREKFLFIDNVAIKRGYFHDLEIIIMEREVFAIYCRTKIKNDDAAPLLEGENNITNCYYIDKGGVIFGEAPKSAGSLISVIREVNDNSAMLGEKVLNIQIINSISNIKTLLLDKNLRVTEFLFRGQPSLNPEVFISEGWRIYFDVRQDIYTQIDILDRALKEKISGQERDALEYVDLRVPGRIYYK